MALGDPTFHVEHAGNMRMLRLGEHPVVKGLVLVLEDLRGDRLVHGKVVDGESEGHGEWSQAVLKVVISV